MRRAKKMLVIKAEDSLVAAIDTLAERQFRSRSDIIRQATLKELEQNGLCPAR